MRTLQTMAKNSPFASCFRIPGEAPQDGWRRSYVGERDQDFLLWRLNRKQILTQNIILINSIHNFGFDWFTFLFTVKSDPLLRKIVS